MRLLGDRRSDREDGVDCPAPKGTGAYPRWRGERGYSKQTIVYNYWFIPFLKGETIIV